MTPDQAESSLGADLVSAIDATGVPTTIKGKVQRAVFRLIAGGMGLEYWEKIRDNLDTIEGRSRVNMVLAEHVAQQALADPEIVERAKARFLGDLARKQENIEAIARKAQAKADLAPDEGGETEEHAEPPQDWMNAFIREAENASSDELRERLATVLAGEAKRPGTFSRSTVRYIAEADKKTLDDFQSVLAYRIGDAIYHDRSWQSGPWFSRGLALETAGLLAGVTGSTHKTFALPDDGTAHLFSQGYAILVKGAPHAKFNCPSWLLSRVGMEVASLLEPADVMAAAKHFAEVIPKSHLERIACGQLVTGPDGAIYIPSLATLWAKPQLEKA